MSGWLQDVNEFPPVFTPSSFYEETILETTAPGTVVETISASDGDSSRSPNGQVLYRLLTGAQDKFLLDEMSGDVVVAPAATFDFDLRNRYDMEVGARMELMFICAVVQITHLAE